MKLVLPILSAFLVAFLLTTAPAAAAMPTHTVSPANIAAVSADRSTVWHLIGGRAKSSWPYYILRASGLVAAALLVLLIIFGIGQVTGFTYRLMEPITAWEVHRAIALAFGASVLVHMIGLVLDTYVPYSVLQVLVPFLYPGNELTIAGYHFGSIFSAMGIIAMYLAILVIISSLLWKDKRPKLWRLFHFLSYIMVVLIFIHALTLGIDLKSGWLRYIWIGLGVLIVIGIDSRLMRSHLFRRKKPDNL